MKTLVLIIFIFNSFLFGLTNEMLADKYLIAAKKYVKAKEYKKAVDSFEKIFDLGIKVPNDIYYFYAKSLKNSGDIIKAYETFNLYIEKTGRGSSHYQEALGFMIDMEDNIVAKKRAIKEEKYRKKQEKLRQEREEKARVKREIERQKEAKLKKSNDLSSKAKKILLKGEDYKYAFSLYKESLEVNKNNKNALCDIAYMYNLGLHVNKDKNIGFKYTKESVKNGYCYNNLGYAYEFGSGVNIDYKEAAKWYRKAIETGTELARSNYHLGVMIAEGKGFVIDYGAAKKMFQKAEKLGDRDASEYIKKLDEKIELIEMKQKMKAYAIKHGFKDYPIDAYIDPNTNLMWQSVKTKDDFKTIGKKIVEKHLSFEEAEEYCQRLILSGFDDWRLPSIKELLSVVRFKFLDSSKYTNIEEMKNKLLTQKLLEDKKFKEFLKYEEPDMDNKFGEFYSGESFVDGLWYVSIDCGSYWSRDNYVKGINSKWALSTCGKNETKALNLTDKSKTICVRSKK